MVVVLAGTEYRALHWDPVPNRWASESVWKGPVVDGLGLVPIDMDKLDLFTRAPAITPTLKIRQTAGVVWLNYESIHTPHACCCT